MSAYKPCPAFRHKTAKPQAPEFVGLNTDWYIECVHEVEHAGPHRSANGEAWVTAEATVIRRG